MESWLINYGNPCPKNWNSFPIGGVNYCYRDSYGVTALTPVVAGQNLHSIAVDGQIQYSNGLPYTVVTYHWQDQAWAVTALDNLVALYRSWNAVEFNIVGVCCGEQAVFNSNATMVMDIESDMAGTPSCISAAGPNGTATAETNNFNLVPGSCCPVARDSITGFGPMLMFTQSNGSATAPFCLLNDIVPMESPLL